MHEKNRTAGTVGVSILPLDSCQGDHASGGGDLSHNIGGRIGDQQGSIHSFKNLHGFNNGSRPLLESGIWVNPDDTGDRTLVNGARRPGSGSPTTAQKNRE